MAYDVYIGSPKGDNFNSVLIQDDEQELVKKLFGPKGFSSLKGMRGSDLYFELNVKTVGLDACIDNDQWLGYQPGALQTFLGKLRTLRNLCHNYSRRKLFVQ
jgi:hypothetical protein